MIRPLLASLGLVALSACTVVPGGGQVPYPAAPEGYRVSIDAPVKVGAVTVTPVELVEDSRCPTGVQCVWAGRLILKTRIDGDGWRETTDLTLGQRYETRGNPVTLVRAEPERREDAPIDPSQYRFTFAGTP